MLATSPGSVLFVLLCIAAFIFTIFMGCTSNH